MSSRPPSIPRLSGRTTCAGPDVGALLLVVLGFVIVYISARDDAWFIIAMLGIGVTAFLILFILVAGVVEWIKQRLNLF